MIKAVLFDFDGTLADTLPFYLKAYDHALKQMGFTFTDREIVAKCFGKKENTICSSLGIPEKTEAFTKAYFDGIEMFKDAPLFPASLPLLDFLKDTGVKTTIITFAYRWYIDRMLAQFGLTEKFDLVISTDDIRHPKPDPEAVLTSCKKLGVKAEDTLVIGDSKSDVLMGNAAGSKTVLFHPKEYELFYSLEDLKKSNPDIIMGNLAELKQLIITINNL